MRSKAIVPALIVSLLLLLAFPQQAYACICGDPTIEEITEPGNIVFRGRVISVVPERDRTSDRIVTVAVQKSWQGDLPLFATVITGGGYGDCGYSFQVGRTYLISAREYEGNLGTSHCTLTAPVADSGEALRFLGPGTATILWRTRQLLLVGAGLGAYQLWRKRVHSEVLDD